jgi:D-alanyl-D-alanine carboxypeptidase
MYNSSFRNASGLHAEGQYTTTYDLARLAIALKRDFPGYYHLFSKKDFEFNGKNFTTHNHVLVEYEGAEGMKTGFTNASGFNLIAVAKKDNSRVISVLLGCESYKKRDEYTKNLLDKTFTKSAKNNDNEIKVKLLENFNYSKIPFDETLENKRHSRLFY